MTVKVNSIDKHGGSSCPYCKGDIYSTELLKTCDSCQTTMHEDCAHELGRCPTIGCEQPFELVLETPVTEGRKPVQGVGIEQLAKMSIEVEERKNKGWSFQSMISKRARYSSMGLKFSLFLTLVWGGFLSYFLGTSIGEAESALRLGLDVAEFLFIYGFLGTFVFVGLSNVAVDNSDYLEETGAAWGFSVAARSMLLASSVALLVVVAGVGSGMGRLVFCIAAVLSYFFFALRSMPAGE